MILAFLLCFLDAKMGQVRAFASGRSAAPSVRLVPARLALPGRFPCPYPNARTRKFRKAVNPNAARARIGRAPSLRLGPDFSRCRGNSQG